MSRASNILTNFAKYVIMYGMTDKQKKTATVITVAAVILLLIALVALVYNLISLGTLSARRAELEARQAELQQIINENEEEIAYRGSWEYIEKYARDHLNMKYEDEEVYEPS